MATENYLWGAPRIHGELLKLGITISERTVSRYLRGRPTIRSQTWRTFVANHFGGQTSISPVIFGDADDVAVVVDASDVSFGPVPSIDALRAYPYGPRVEWRRSLQPASLDVHLGHHHRQDQTGARTSSGRDPPARPVATSLAAAAPISFLRAEIACEQASVGSIYSRVPREMKS